MRSLDETVSRWEKTQACTTSLEELRHSVRYNGSTSPCVSGCRSLCWKTFLLSQSSTDPSWSQILVKGRAIYSEHRDHLLKFIKHPEALAQLTIDPLADDPNSPWNTVRQDEVVRAEIMQDVQRLPDEASYHEELTQTMILDILFIYCKLNPGRGGYRQGMHELLAPIVHVIQQDAVDRQSVPANSSPDESMLQILDAAYIEHDAFVLFSRLMDSAQSFYEIKDSNPNPTGLSPSIRFQEQSSAIVERSKFIHEVCLRKIDPDLAVHLTSIEILPQIFLIRWVRLLFSREFPFEEFLIFWDTIFAVDPTLELIDLICVAMLIRIRWDLLEADYSVCLQLLLKYPPPTAPHGPQSFVDDALYLRNHLNSSGGASLIMKYTGKMPIVSSPPETSRSTTPNFRGFNSFKQRGFGTRSPLPSPSRFLQQQGGMEALFQGAAKGAKGVLERGEKLGINQAVRDAVGEIRRNLNEARYPVRSPREVLSEEGPTKGMAALEKRNIQLASMLEETIENLKSLSTSNLDDKAKSLELIEVAAAKIQFVKIYLEDSSMEVPILNSPPVEESMDEPVPRQQDPKSPKGKEGQSDSAIMTPIDVDVAELALDDKPSVAKKQDENSSPNPDSMDTSDDKTTEEKPAEVTNKSNNEKNNLTVRPSAPIPTRSTLAQSSFSWMLEPDESSSPQPPSATPRSPPSQHKKRASNNASRERNAFLFGEVPSGEGKDPLISDDIFGLQPMRKSKGSSD